MSHKHPETVYVTGEKTIYWRIAALAGVLLLSIVAMAFFEPIPQDPGYHKFTDQRGLFGIPNFGDTASNLIFLLVGAYGVFLCLGSRATAIFDNSADARPFLIFFAGCILIAFGSGYYHWAPDTERLVWDRLPMTISFMAISAAMVADRIHRKSGNGWLLWLLLPIGVASVVYWSWTESLGRGDLRFYALVQFFPLLGIPLVLVLFRHARYLPTTSVLWVIFWYGLAKVFEYFDRGIYDLLGQTVSGHSLKHLVSGGAFLVVAWTFRKRALR